MLIPRFTYHSPATLEEALNILSRHTKAAILAGGTDLVVNMKKNVVSPKDVISIQKIDVLSQIHEERNYIRIGTGVTAAEIANSEIFPLSMRTLVQSSKNLGSPLIRNRATIGGNIMSARPAADLICSLLALEADVELTSNSGRRIVSLPDMLKGPGLTAIGSEEILTSILIEKQPAGTGSDYQSIGIRKVQDVNLINVSTVLGLDENNFVTKARVAIGCVGPTHILSRSATESLESQKITFELIDKSAEAAMNDCDPIDDFRTSADYRKKMARVLTRRALRHSWEQAMIAS